MAHAAGSHTALGKALNLPIAVDPSGSNADLSHGRFWGTRSFLLKHTWVLGLERLLCKLRWVLGVSVLLGWLGIGALGKLQSFCWSPSLHV